MDGEKEEKLFLKMIEGFEWKSHIQHPQSLFAFNNGITLFEIWTHTAYKTSGERISKDLDCEKIIANYRLGQILDFKQNLPKHEIWFHEKIIKEIFNYTYKDIYLNTFTEKFIIKSFLDKMTKNVLKMNTLEPCVIAGRSFLWDRLEYFD